MNVREFLSCLENEGLLLRIDEELDPKYEISACLKLITKEEDGPTVLFENVKGYRVPVCGNLLSSKKKLALALGVDQEVFWQEYRKRLTHPISPVIVEEAPVQETIINDVDILKEIPVLTYHEKDASPYITQGVTFLKDSETGKSSMGVHRLQVKDRDRLGYYISVSSVTSASIIKNADEKGGPVPVAIAIGVEPSLLLACYSISAKHKLNKVDMAGGLRGRPIELVKAKTVDIDVPANAMFIIEGELLPRTLDVDGPFGEALGYYISGEGRVIHVKMITRQREPIYSVSQPFSRDDHINSFMKIQIEQFLKSVIPNLKSVGFYFPSSLLVVSIHKKEAWQSRSALYTCLNMLVLAKYVIVVDDDVDPTDMGDVAFALSGRCQPDRDVIVISDVLGFDLDPSLREGCVTSKLGIDATRPFPSEERFEKVKVPRECLDKAVEVLKSCKSKSGVEKGG